MVTLQEAQSLCTAYSVEVSDVTIRLHDIRDPITGATTYDIQSTVTMSPLSNVHGEVMEKKIVNVFRFSEVESFDASLHQAVVDPQTENIFTFLLPAQNQNGDLSEDDDSMLPPLPGKRFWGRFAQDFLEERRQGLQEYFTNIVEIINGILGNKRTSGLHGSVVITAGDEDGGVKSTVLALIAEFFNLFGSKGYDLEEVSE